VTLYPRLRANAGRPRRLLRIMTQPMDPVGALAQPEPRGRTLRRALAAVLVTLLLGVAAGFLWAALAPRPYLVMTGPGAAQVTSAESSAFIGGDGWYCLICLAGGIISGLIGYLLAVRGHHPVGMALVLLGGLAAALIALWIGQHSGQASYHHLLSTLPAGRHLSASLSLGARSAIALWPLAAGIMAGALELNDVLRDRRRGTRDDRAFALD
jgi:hypothetical protein